MPVYAVPIQPIRVNGPNYSFKELGEAFDTFRGWRTGRAVGEKLSGNDLRGASAAAFSGGDMRTGIQLRELEQREASENERLGMERSRLGMRRQEMDREEQQRQVTILGNLAETVRGIEDPDQRKAAWDRLVAGTPRLGEILRQYGQDPADHVNGPGFIIAQTRDPLQRRATEANIEAARARGSAREMDAETRRMRVLYDKFIEFAGRNPSEEDWNRESGPNGIVSALFPNQSFPRDALPRLVQQAQEQRGQFLSDEEHRAIVDAYGPAKRGFKWVRKPDGTVTQELVAQGTKPVDPAQARSASYHLNTIRKAEKTLTDAWYAERAVAGSLDIGRVGQALQDYKQGILGIVYAQSGKQTHVKEMEMWLQAYGPSPWDSDWRIKEKTKRVRDYMKAQFGIDMDALEQAGGGESRGQPTSRSVRTVPVGPQPPTAAPRSDDVQRLYDKYGLE